MKILITGISGLLGPYLAEEFLKLNPKKIVGLYNENEPLYSGIKTLKTDITNSESVLELEDFDLILHCAALTNVDGCELNPKKAEAINVNGTANLLALAKRGNSKFVYVSTEAVFFEKELADEDDDPNPKSVYAKTKLQGEELVRNSGISHLILRTTIFGPSLNGQKKMYEWMFDNLSEGHEIKAIEDNDFTPITTKEFSRLTRQLIEKEFSGTYHVVSDRRISRYDLAVRFAELFGYDVNYIKPIQSSDLGLKAPRSKSASLDNSKLKTALEIRRISLVKQLEELRR